MNFVYRYVICKLNGKNFIVALTNIFCQNDKIRDIFPALREHLEREAGFEGDIDYEMVEGYRGGRPEQSPTIIVTTSSDYSLANPTNDLHDTLSKLAVQFVNASSQSYKKCGTLVSVRDYAGPVYGFGDDFIYQDFKDENMTRQINLKTGEETRLPLHDGDMRWAKKVAADKKRLEVV